MPERLTPEVMAMVAARDFHDGAVVNLGLGLPLECSNYTPAGREVLYHSEQGILGFGPMLQSREGVNPLLLNAGGRPVATQPGMCFMSHEESFALARGGHLDFSVLGAMQVDQRGNLANAKLPGKPAPGLGGAPDLATCAKRTIIITYHTLADGTPKLVEECDMVLTALECVDRVVTDVAVIDIALEGFVIREHAPGWSVEEIQALTGAPLIVAEDLREISLA